MDVAFVVQRFGNCCCSTRVDARVPTEHRTKEPARGITVAKVQEPIWLQPLIDGDFASAPITSGLVRSNSRDHGSTATLAQVACVAALAGYATDHDVVAIDPTIGSGEMLATLAQAVCRSGGRVAARGVDLNEPIARAAADRVRPYAVSVDVHAANTLTDDVLKPAEADLVVCEPPWGLRWDPVAADVLARAKDGWYPYGVGAKTDSTWLFV